MIESILAYEAQACKLCIFFTFSIFAKHHFYAPGSCLNCQSGLVLSKTDQTKAKETLIDRKYTGVRARTPCIFLTFFIFAEHDFYASRSCLNCQSRFVLSKIYQTEANKL